MNAHVSLGSQPQKRPQALSAQIAPAMTAKVQIGKPKTAVRWATRSRPAADGTRAQTPEAAAAAPRPPPPARRAAGSAGAGAAPAGGAVPGAHQVEQAGDAAEEEGAEAEDGRRHVRGQPARPQRRH